MEKLKERLTTNICILRKTHFCVFLKSLGKLSNYHGNTKECHEFYCKIPGCLHAERGSHFPHEALTGDGERSGGPCLFLL